MFSRREFIGSSLLLSSSTLFKAKYPWRDPAAVTNRETFLGRPCPAERLFHSSEVERFSTQISQKIGNPILRRLFIHGFPSAIDFGPSLHAKPSIPESTSALWAYLPLVSSDPVLRQILIGTIAAQTLELREMQACGTVQSAMESFGYFVRLSYHLWKTTGIAVHFTERWHQAIERFALCTEKWREESAGDPFFVAKIPTLLFFDTAARQLNEIIQVVGGSEQSVTLVQIFSQTLQTAAGIVSGRLSRMPYASDKNGNDLYMDVCEGVNVVSLPYLAGVSTGDPAYLKARKRIFSEKNPFYFTGRGVEGTGSARLGFGYIGTEGILMRALSARSEEEIKKCLQCLTLSHLNVCYLSEHFRANEPTDHRSPCFIKANMLFSEMVIKMVDTHPHLLNISV